MVDLENQVQRIEGLVVRCDASVALAQQHGRWAFVISDGEKLIAKQSGDIGNSQWTAGSFSAEMWSILLSLRFLWTKKYEGKPICVMSDAVSVVRCLNGENDCPEKYRVLHEQIADLRERLGHVTFVWFSRKFNKEADRLASQRAGKSTDFTSRPKRKPKSKLKQRRTGPWKTGIYPEVVYRRGV